MAQAEAALAAEVEGWLAQAERRGRGRRCRAWRRPARRRAARLGRRQAGAARAHPRGQGGARGRGQGRAAARDAEPGPSSGMSDHGRPRRAPDGGPPARAQRNFTDPDSRILKTRDGFIQGYNGQLAVDAAHQIIVAQRLTTNGSDQAGLVPLLDATRPRSAASRARSRPMPASAARANLEALGGARHPRLSRAGPRRPRHAPTRAAAGGSSPARGWPRWRPGSSAPAGARAIGLRKQTVEPVIGQIKQARGFRQFLLRGFAKVEAEWALVCTAHNLTKLLAARRRLSPLSPEPRPAPPCPSPHPSVTAPAPSRRPITRTGS